MGNIIICGIPQGRLRVGRGWFVCSEERGANTPGLGPNTRHIGKSLVTSTCLTGKVTCVTCADFLLGKSPQVKNLTCVVGTTSQSSGVDLGTYRSYGRRDRRLSTSARPLWLVHRLLVTNGACGGLSQGRRQADPRGCSFPRLEPWISRSEDQGSRFVSDIGNPGG